MRVLWRAPLLALMRRSPQEIEKRSRSFRIASDDGRLLVAGVGGAFIGGFNAMISRPSLAQVAVDGEAVAVHFRPFFFEGAAMGYLPRGVLHAGPGRARAEADLLSLGPAYRYLYYVGLGFWFAMRSRRPASLLAMQPHLDPMHYPLCFDGYGFKRAFYDDGSRPGILESLADAPEEFRPSLYQGFGRALHFVFMDDAAGFEALVARAPAPRRLDLEFGRALALGFTRIDRPMALVEHAASARDDDVRASRLAGLTWALTARRMNDEAYFRSCIASSPPAVQRLLARLPAECLAAFAASSRYAEWQERTRALAMSAWGDAAL